ncbi:hypothetical protein PG991_001736 [Apiospora marii]|uniref:DUF676 domain-containing protein n=1 Tax=Apiospora marii TaxID=335849 RepID=A0ABR1SQJ3_9PEZI
MPYGLEIVFEGDDPVVDIVAVHGLNGHREQTWVASNGTHWLRDLLPVDIPNARILCWGYDANTHSSSGISQQTIYKHGRSLVTDLRQKRELTGTMQRPIIFIAHSLGGIIVKSALIHSDTSRRGALLEHRSIRLSTFGIMFMGTPHQGGNGVQVGKLLVNIASLFMAANNHILRDLERDSEWLQQQLGQYAPISGDFVTKFAYEDYPTRTALGHSIMVVPYASAVVPGQADAEPIVIHADHINMVKFLSKGDPGYSAVSGEMQIMMRTAIERVQSNLHNTFSLPLDLSEVTIVEHFVARTEELESLHAILEKPAGRRRTAVVHGLGGMGKTQLAVEYLRHHQSDYSATIWLNARDETSLQQSFVQVAERLLQLYPQPTYIKVALGSLKPREITDAVKRWFDEPQNDRWLLVYDNYDDPKLDNGRHKAMATEQTAETEPEGDGTKAHIPSKEYDIRPYFPASDHGAIIITTRSSVVQFGKRVRLAKLRDLNDGLQILASTSHRDDVEKDQAAVEVAKRLDGLPLALATAGVYLFDVTTSWAEYLEMYQKSWSRLQQESPDLPAYDSTMYATWNISFVRIQKQDQAAAKLLGMWAYFDKDDLWYELLHQRDLAILRWLEDITEDRIIFDKTMRVLCSHGLVDADPATRECGAQSRGYNVHGCVHSWMQHVLNPTTNLKLAKAAVQCVARHVPDKTEREFWWVQRRLLQHADHGLSKIGPNDDMHDEAWAFYNLGNLYASQGRLGEAEAMYQRALQGKEKAWGAEHTSTLSTVNNLGNLYASQGRLGEAEAMYQRALQGKEKAWGAEHTSTLSTVNNLGLLYKAQGRLGEAEAMYQRALQGKEKAWGAEHTSTLDTVNNLGNLYAEQGRLGEAEAMYQRALQGYEKALGDDMVKTYPPALNTLENLGDLFQKQGKVEGGKGYYGRAEYGMRIVYGVGSRNHENIVAKLQSAGIS